MNEIEERFGWRLKRVVDLVREEDYNNAFSEYSNLVKLFNRLEGYEEHEKMDFYKKVKYIGDDLLFKLFKRKILSKIKKHKFSINDFKRRLKELMKEGPDEKICNLIKKEEFEEALRRFYENK